MAAAGFAPKVRSMPRLLRPLALVAAGLVLASASACGGETDDGGDKSEPLVLSAVHEDVDPAAPLPPGVCFAATRTYGVQLFGRAGNDAGLCDRLADRFLPREAGRGAWPMPGTDPDDLPQHVCTLAQKTKRIEVLEFPDRSGQLDVEAICETLTSEGWELRPAEEGLDG